MQPSVNVTSSSVIHYMEIVNENPDSEETMLHLAEDLVSTIQSSSQQEWQEMDKSDETVTKVTALQSQEKRMLKQKLFSDFMPFSFIDL